MKTYFYLFLSVKWKELDQAEAENFEVVVRAAAEEIREEFVEESEIIEEVPRYIPEIPQPGIDKHHWYFILCPVSNFAILVTLLCFY